MWEKIETAPKDGRHILLGSPKWATCWHGYWRAGREPGTPVGAAWGDPGWTRTNFCDTGLEPTHWHPLPEPPRED